MPARILIVYGTSYGQTAKIAARIREQLVARGFSVGLYKGDALPSGLALSGYDAVVVGASLIIGGHQRYIGRFIRRHAPELQHIPSAFFSVSGSAGSEKVEQRATARRIMAEFLRKSGWSPELETTFAGAITYTRYNPVLRWWMKRISRAEGGSTDTSRDHEYTDWSQVEQFATEVARMAEERREQRGANGEALTAGANGEALTARR